MTRLKSEPERPVQSLAELFAIAHDLKCRAAAHYAQLASAMLAAGRPRLSELFRDLARDEECHAERIRAAAGVPEEASDLAGGDDGPFDDEDASLASPILQSAYGLLAMAVRNKERAFAFWSYVAADADAPEVVQAAEHLADEELAQARRLRVARRAAYHADRESAPLRLSLADAEARAADLLVASASEATGWQTFVEGTRANARDLAQAPLRAPFRTGPPPAASLEALLEWLVQRYLEAGEKLTDEAARVRAQQLAERAITRLAFVRRNRPDVPAEDS